MPDTIFAHHFAIGAATAAVLEALRLYEKKHEISIKMYSLLLRSPLFWLVMLAAILAAGGVAWVLHRQSAEASIVQLALTGAAVRALIRQILAVATVKNPIRLGASERPPLRELFK